MGWIGWVLAFVAALAAWKFLSDSRKAEAALAIVQIEIAKLCDLWAQDVAARRKLQDEYDRPTEPIRSECMLKFREASEPMSLFAYSVLDPGEHLFTSRHEPVNKVLFESDPEQWGKQLVPMILSFVTKKD